MSYPPSHLMALQALVLGAVGLPTSGCGGCRTSACEGGASTPARLSRLGAARRLRAGARVTRRAGPARIWPLCGALVCLGCDPTLGDKALDSTRPDSGAGEDTACGGGDTAASSDAEPVCNDGVDNDCDGAPDCAPAEGLVAPESASAALTGGYQSAFGTGMALVDLDGDGLRDLAVSDALYPRPGQDGVYLVRGPLMGAQAIEDAAFASLTSPDHKATGGLLQAGDLDGDGQADLALSQGEGDEDGVWLADGPFSGERDLDRGVDLFLGAPHSGDAPTRVEPSLGDVLGDDGQPDLVVRLGANPDGLGAVFVIAGPISASGDLSAQATSVFGAGDDASPEVFAVVGDLDGDGRVDLVLDHGLPCASFALPEGAFTEESFCDAYLTDVAGAAGGQIVRAGDVDGDGYSDVIASTAALDGATAEEHTARLYAGGDLSALAPGGALDADGYRAALDDAQDGSNNLGHGVASPGDLDGDGYDEVVASAPTWAYTNDPGEEYGATFLWYGPLEGALDPEETAGWTVRSEDEDSWLGFRVLAAPADDRNNATILLSAWPFEGTGAVIQFTPGGY